MNRRGFIQLLAGSIAAAGTGITLLPRRPEADPVRMLYARHLYRFDPNLFGGGGPLIAHRIDVKFPGDRGIEQWHVDLLTKTEKLDAERELAPALATLNHALKGKGVEVGEIFTFSFDDWFSNKDARAKWEELGPVGRLS